VGFVGGSAGVGVRGGSLRFLAGWFDFGIGLCVGGVWAVVECGAARGVGRARLGRRLVAGVGGLFLAALVGVWWLFGLVRRRAVFLGERVGVVAVGGWLRRFRFVVGGGLWFVVGLGCLGCGLSVACLGRLGLAVSRVGVLGGVGLLRFAGAGDAFQAGGLPRRSRVVGWGTVRLVTEAGSVGLAAFGDVL